MSINNYLKVISKHPALALYLDKSSPFESPPKYFEEYWFFDDQDALSTSAALTKARAFRDRQPQGVRFQVSIYRSISVALEIPQVGQPSYVDGRRRQPDGDAVRLRAEHGHVSAQ